MSRVLRLISATLALLGLAGLGLAVAGAASAAPCPYSSCVSIAVSDQNPPEGGTDGVTGSGWTPGDTVNLTLHTATYSLGSATVAADGTFSTTVDLPDGVTGNHTVVGTDPATGDTASADITIGGSGTGDTSGSSGGLSNTGVAVLSIGALGVVLLVGGGLLMLAGRRRKVTV